MRRMPNVALLAAAAAALALAACDSARQVEETHAAGATGCTGCHGDATRSDADPLVHAAPPGSVRGGDGGAHLAHLRAGTFRPAIACRECHDVPTSKAHVDGNVPLTFRDLASRAGATPRFDPATQTCSGVYCHGATLSGGGAPTPAWSPIAAGALGKANLDCSSCHGYPPPNHNPAAKTCSVCHPGTVGRDGRLLIANGLHVNGTIDVEAHGPGWRQPANHGRAAKKDLAMCRECHGSDYGGGIVGVSCNACHAAAGFASWQTTCTFCHGDPARPTNAPAPPEGTQGETTSDTRAVGAHQRHLSGGSFGAAVACTECHVVPTSLDHVNGTPLVTFGQAARRGGAEPTWNGTSCSVYCHGATLDAGGAKTAPEWTQGSTQVFCGSCHAAPPPPPHTTLTTCGACHTGYSQTSVNAALHMNGTLDVSSGHPAGWRNKEQHGYTATRTGFSSCKVCHGPSLDGAGGAAANCGACHEANGFTAWWSNCTFCHGDRATGRPSPPVDTQGRTDPRSVTVGVHASHVGTTITTPLACTECHENRAGSNVVTDAAHVDGDGVAEVSFGALARTGGTPATYGRASATCASTYCHGGFPNGRGATMTWTSADQVNCGSCHGGPPRTGEHDKHLDEGIGCAECHGHAGSGATHLNGRKDLPFPAVRGPSFVPSTASCGSFTCHGESHSSSRRWR